MQTKAAIAAEYVRRFPKTGSQTLAKLAYKENVSLWPSLHAARQAIQYVRGAHGTKNRRNAQDNYSKDFRPQQKAGTVWDSIPEPKSHWDSEWAAVVLKGPFRGLVLSDAHIPYHDKTALMAALEQGKRDGCDLIKLNGDIADFFSISFWEKDPRKRNFKDELGHIREFLAIIRKQFPKARIVYKLGNHEERLERYMKVKAPELMGIEEYTVEHLLRLDNIGAEVVRDMRPVKMGQLNVIHGHEYRFSISNPVNPARGLYLRAKVHALCGHFHQSSQHSETNLEGKIISTWSTGCLCQLHPDYRPLNNHGHGFAIVNVDKQGSFEVINQRIIHGRVY